MTIRLVITEDLDRSGCIGMVGSKFWLAWFQERMIGAEVETVSIDNFFKKFS